MIDQPSDPFRDVRDLIRGRDRAALATTLPVERRGLALRLAGAGGGGSRSLADPADQRPRRTRQGDCGGRRGVAAVRRHGGFAQPLTGPRVSLLGAPTKRRRPAEAALPAVIRMPGCMPASTISISTAWRPSAPTWWGASARSAGRRGRAPPEPPPRGAGRERAGIVAHMNDDHADALAALCRRLLGMPAATGG